LHKKWPYDDVARDVRSQEIDDGREPMDIDEMIRDRETGKNAEPTDGPRDGVTHARKMHPNRYYPNCRSK